MVSVAWRLNKLLVGEYLVGAFSDKVLTGAFAIRLRVLSASTFWEESSFEVKGAAGRFSLCCPAWASALGVWILLAVFSKPPGASLAPVGC